METYKLKDSHAIALKLEQLNDFATSLGISIYFGLNGPYINGKYLVKDVDTDTPITHFPFTTEYKIVFED